MILCMFVFPSVKTRTLQNVCEMAVLEQQPRKLLSTDFTDHHGILWEK